MLRLKTSLSRLFSWPQRQAGSRANYPYRTILAVTPLACEHNTLRVLALLEGWHLRIAPTLDVAIQFRREEAITAIIYDSDLPGVEWRNGVASLLTGFPPVCLVLLSFTTREPIRLNLIDKGGWDVAQKPIQGGTLVPIIKGYLALTRDIDVSSWTRVLQRQ